MKTALNCLLSIFIIISTASCKNDLEKNLFNGAWQLPIAQADIKINELVPDSLILVDTNNELSLVLSQELANYPLKELLDPIERGLEKTIKLSTIKIGKTSIFEKITLGELSKDAGLVGAVIRQNHGNTINIPPVENLPASNFPIDASEYFEEMNLDEGAVVLSFHNGFPIDIENMKYKIYNASSPSDIIFIDSIALLAAGASESRWYPLDDKIVEGDLIAELWDMESPGSEGSPVYIDTSDALEIQMDIDSLVPFSATAIFPKQQIADDTAEHYLSISDNLKLNRMILRSGEFNLVAHSTIQDTVRFRYTLPGMKKNGIPFSTSGILNPAPPGGSVSLEKSVDFTGYTLDLTGKDFDTINTFFDIFEAWIDSSGTLTQLSLEDSIYMNSVASNIVASKAFGILQRDTINIELDTIAFDFLPTYLSGTINSEKAKAKLLVENHIGTEAALKPMQFGLIGHHGTAYLLAGSMNTFSQIDAATDAPSGTSANSSISAVEWNGNNSNINDLLSVIPQQAIYEAQFILNPSNEQSETFIYYDNGLRSSLDIEFPLGIGLGNLILLDSSMTEISIDEFIDKDLQLNLHAQNQFPFNLGLEVHFLDAFADTLFSLNLPGFLKAGVPNVDGKVELPTNSTESFTMSQAQRNQLNDVAKITYKINANSYNQDIYPVFADYSVQLNLVAEWSE